MAKRKAEAKNPLAAPGSPFAQPNSKLIPVATCAGCEFFEPEDARMGKCHRYPQMVGRYSTDRACGEWSER